MQHDTTTAGNRNVDSALLLGLGIFTAVALAGFATFGRHPALLAVMPSWALSFYTRSFGFFALGHVIISFLVLATVLTRAAGVRWVAPFIAVYSISLTSELAGTTWGLPFGEYQYSELLAPMWLGRVPVVIPLSWFAMALPSYALAVVAVRGRLPRVALASFILLAWDLALDPAMSFVTPYWSWGEGGVWYGMPWLNLVGWYVTGVLLAGTLALLGAERWTVRLAPRWWMTFYALNLALPLGMCVVAGLWPAVLATTLVLGVLARSLGFVTRPVRPLVA